MEQNFKPIMTQLVIGAIILASITVFSFGIRQVRLSTYRYDSGELTLSTRPSDPKDRSQPKQHFNTSAEPNHSPADSYTVNDKPDPQDIEESFWDEQESSDDYSEENDDSFKYDKAISKAKSFKSDYVNTKNSKGLKQISLSEREELYFSEKGEFWYVSKEPDGSTTKMQVQVDKVTGEFTVVDGGYYAKSEGSQDLHRIPVSDNENIYLTEEGEAWYVSEQPDGSTAKVQLPID